MTTLVTREDVGGLCTLTLNRPEKLNALDTGMFKALDAHISALKDETDRIGCVILRGAGRAFCAGMDLNVVGREAEPPEFKADIIDRLARLPQPVIGAIHGACYTGGLELALACDFLVADSSARIADTHGKWGLVAIWGMYQRLPRRVGTAAAMRMAMTSATIDAHEAHAICLVDYVAEEGEFNALVDRLAADILANSWFVNLAAKRFMRETDGMSLEDGLALERANRLGHAPDSRDRIARFKK